MADYDAGTARGRFRLDAESRGVEEVNRSVKSFRDALSSVKDRVGGFNASLNRAEEELRQIKRDFEEADRAAKDFEKDANGVDVQMRKNSQSTKQWTGDLEALHTRLRGVSEAAATFGPIGLQVGRFAREMNNLRGTDSGALTRIATSFVRIGGMSTVFSLIKGHFLGIGAALRMMGPGANEIVRVANSFRLLTFGVGLITRFDLVSRGWARAIDLVAKRSVDAAYGMVKFGDGVQKVLAPIQPAVNWIKELNQHLDGFAGGAVSTVAGLALLRSGFQGLSRNFGFLTGQFQTGNYFLDMFLRAIRFVFMPGIILSSAASQAFGKSLVFISNTLVGLLDGIKQLAGGFLAIPGAIAEVGVAAATMKIIFGDLKDSFKELFKDIKSGDAAKVAEDLDKLPPYLRDIGQAITEVLPQWQNMQHALTQTFTQGAADQLRWLTSALLPALGTGAIQVANSWRIAKDQVVAFVGQSRTLSAIQTIFMNTAQTMNALSTGIQPVLGGFRDLASVGTGFIRTLAEDYVPGLTREFGLWANGMSESGRALQVMNNSIQGAKDLWHGFEDAIKGVWTILTIFKTNSGQGFLAGFATEMQKFNDAVQKSAQGGILKKFGDEMKSLGTDKIRALIDILKQLVDPIKAFISMMSQAGNAMNNIMIPVLTVVVSVVGQFVQALNSLGIGPIIGTVLGLVSAFKMLGFVFGPILNFIKIFSGFKFIASGLESMFTGLAGALGKFGPLGTRAGEAVLNIGESAVSAAGLVGSLIGVAVAGFALWAQNNKYVADGLKEIADDTRHATDATNALRAAFAQDNGEIGAHVFDTMRQNTRQAFADIQSQAQKAPGIMDHIAQAFRVDYGRKGTNTWFHNPFAESDVFNDMQRVFDNSKKVQEGFDAIGISADQVSDALTRGSPQIDRWANQLVRMGHPEAADKLEEMRLEFDRIAASAAAAGPGALQLEQGIEKLAQAGGNATSKLEGLKTALQGLGLLKTDAYEAAFNYAKAVDELAENAKKAADASQPLGKALLDQNGLFNTNSVNARNLFNVLHPLAEDFLVAASKGENVNDMWQRMQPNLEAVANSFRLNREELDKLIASMGVDPKIVSILVQLQGKGEVASEMAQILATAEANVGNGVEVPVHFKTDQMAADAQAELDKVFGPGSSRREGANIFLKPGIDEAALQRLEAYLSQKYGIKLTPDSPAPPAGVGAQVPMGPSPTPIPNTPEGAPPPAPKEGQPGYVPPSKQPPKQQMIIVPGQGLVPVGPPPTAAPAPAPQPTPQPAPPPPQPPPPPPAAPAVAPANLAAVEDANAKVTALNDQLKALSSQKAVIQVDTAQLDAIQPKTVDISNQVKGVADSIKQSFVNAFNDIVASIGTFKDQAVEKLNEAAAAARAAGEHFSQDFAAGINSPDAIAKIAQAATDAAAAAKAKLPANSPAKSGPLSGTGWTMYAGQHFTVDFATGIVSKSDVAAGAASKVAAQVKGKLTPYGNFEGAPDVDPNYLGQFKQILDLAGNGLNMFKGIGTSLFQFASFLKNPTGAANDTKENTKSVSKLTEKLTAESGAAQGKPIGPPPNEALMRQWAQQQFGIPDSMGTGSWTNASHPADQGWHGRGFAFDFHGTQQQMAAMANWIATNAASQTLELIYQGPGFDPSNLIKNAKPGAAGVYGPGTLSEHTDHVHWATDVAPYLAQANANAMPAAAGTEPTTVSDLHAVGPPPPKVLPSDQSVHAGAPITPVSKAPSDQTDKNLQQISDNTSSSADSLKSVDSNTGKSADQGDQAAQDPVQTASTIFSAATGIAGDIIDTLKSGLEVIGATKNMTDIMVRGISGTKDVSKMIDDVQKYIEFAAKVAQSVGDVANQIGSIVGAAGGASGMPGGGGAGAALQAVGQVAQLISAVLTGINAAIDLGQEAAQIFGSYFGGFLGFLTGGNTEFMGDVKFLLDKNTGQLLNYSADNPLLKTSHPIPGAIQNPNANNQAIGQLNYYAGPGVDPRDSTRQMMYQVQASQLNTVTAQ